MLEEYKKYTKNNYNYNMMINVQGHAFYQTLTKLQPITTTNA